MPNASVKREKSLPFSRVSLRFMRRTCRSTSPYDMAAQVQSMAAALRDHHVAGALFARPGRAEQSFVACDPDTGVMCRVRADWMPDPGAGERQLVVDYKTTASAEPGAFAGSMGKFGYHVQGAWYCDALAWLETPGHRGRAVLVAGR